MRKGVTSDQALTPELKSWIRKTIFATVEDRGRIDQRAELYGRPTMSAIAKAKSAADGVTLPKYLVGLPKGRLIALEVAAARREFLSSCDRLLKALSRVYPIDPKPLLKGGRPKGLGYLADLAGKAGLLPELYNAPLGFHSLEAAQTAAKRYRSQRRRQVR